MLFFVAAVKGFEPLHTESESAVLPLHNTAMWNLQVVLYNAVRTMSSLFCTKNRVLRQQKIALVFKHQQHADRRCQQKQQADDYKNRILHARLVFGEQRLQIQQNHARKYRRDRRNIGKIPHTNAGKAGVKIGK